MRFAVLAALAFAGFAVTEAIGKTPTKHTVLTFEELEMVN